MARVKGGEEGKVCDQIQPIEQELAERDGDDGESTDICGRYGEGIHADVVVFQER